MNNIDDGHPWFPDFYAKAEPFTGTTDEALAIIARGSLWHDPVTGRAILADPDQKWRFEPEGGANAAIASLSDECVLRRDGCMEEGIDLYVVQT